MPKRTYEWADQSNSESTDFLLHMSGLEYCRRVLSKEYPEAPITKTLGFTFESVEKGHAVLTMEPHAYLMHGRGLLHGGVIATLLDNAMAWAALSIVAKGYTLTTAHLAVDFIRPTLSRSGPLRIEGRVVNAGRRTILLEATVVATNGKLVAKGSSTCLTFEKSLSL